MKKRKKKKPLVHLVVPAKRVEPEGNRSEVAILLQQIDTEYNAASLGLSGLAYGVSQHAFITARMEKIEDVREQLVELVGDEDETTRLVGEQMNKPAESLSERLLGRQSCRLR